MVQKNFINFEVSGIDGITIRLHHGLGTLVAAIGVAVSEIDGSEALTYDMPPGLFRSPEAVSMVFQLTVTLLALGAGVWRWLLRLGQARRHDGFTAGCVCWYAGHCLRRPAKAMVPRPDSVNSHANGQHASAPQYTTNAIVSIGRLWNTPILLISCQAYYATFAAMLLLMHAVFTRFASKA